MAPLSAIGVSACRTSASRARTRSPSSLRSGRDDRLFPPVINSNRWKRVPRPPAASTPGVVPAGRLDLDHVGLEVGQQHRAVRPRRRGRSQRRSAPAGGLTSHRQLYCCTSSGASWRQRRCAAAEARGSDDRRPAPGSPEAGRCGPSRAAGMNGVGGRESYRPPMCRVCRPALTVYAWRWAKAFRGTHAGRGLGFARRSVSPAPDSVLDGQISISTGTILTGAERFRPSGEDRRLVRVEGFLV